LVFLELRNISDHVDPRLATLKTWRHHGKNRLLADEVQALSPGDVNQYQQLSQAPCCLNGRRDVCHIFRK